MYLTPKLKPSTVICENTHQGQSTDERTAPSCSSLRCWLLFWASLRLAVSVLWSGVLLIWAYQSFVYHQRQATFITETPYVFIFVVVAVASQLVEFGMIVTFIIAGIKRSASLYRVYYRYCIFTLLVYIIAVMLVLTLDYDCGHYFGDIYLTYHLNELPVTDDAFIFSVTAILEICLEVLLINLIKRLINNYSYVGNNVSVACENA